MVSNLFLTINFSFMKNVKFFFCVVVVALTTMFIYSCAKDGTDQKAAIQNLQTETRGASFCEDESGSFSGLPYLTITIPVIGLSSYPN